MTEANLPFDNKKRGVGQAFSPEERDKVMEELFWEMRLGHDMTRVCERKRGEKRWPDVRKIHMWIADNKEYQLGFAKAKEQQGTAEFEKSSEIYTQVAAGTLDPNAAKVLLDIVKWRSGRLNPKKYHDKFLDSAESKTQEVVIRIPELEALRK